MVSLARTLRNISRVGLREWARQMLYIGDAKSGKLVGADSLVTQSPRTPTDGKPISWGNRYYENTKAEEEIPGIRSLTFAVHVFIH